MENDWGYRYLWLSNCFVVACIRQNLEDWFTPQSPDNITDFKLPVLIFQHDNVFSMDKWSRELKTKSYVHGVLHEDYSVVALSMFLENGTSSLLVYPL